MELLKTSLLSSSLSLSFSLSPLFIIIIYHYYYHYYYDDDDDDDDDVKSGVARP